MLNKFLKWGQITNSWLMFYNLIYLPSLCFCSLDKTCLRVFHSQLHLHLLGRWEKIIKLWLPVTGLPSSVLVVYCASVMVVLVYQAIVALLMEKFRALKTDENKIKNSQYHGISGESNYSQIAKINTEKQSQTMWQWYESFYFIFKSPKCLVRLVW